MCIMSNTTMRFNITLPDDVGTKLKASKNRSQVIARSLRKTFALEEQEHLNAVLAEGYAKRAKEDTTLNQEFDHMISDGIEK